MNGLLTNLLILLALVAVVVAALRIAQSIFGTGSKKAAATEVAAKLVSYPTGSSAVLRRRFVRALTGQHVIMPSGERLAFSELTIRVAPEDLERLDPDGDLDRLGDDAARLYVAHAEREGWAVPRDMRVVVEVDPALRSGWVPPARGTARGEVVHREPAAQVGWDAVARHPSSVSAPLAPPEPAGTKSFPALVPDLQDSMPTMNVVGELRLQQGSDVVTIPASGAILGRLDESPMTFAQPEVSYRHAAVRRLGTQWQVQDLGSTNGTTVDGQRLAQGEWETVRTGSVVALAGVRLTASTDTFGTVHLEGATSQS